METRKDLLKAALIALLVTYVVFLGLVLSGIFPLGETTLITISLGVGIIEAILIFVVMKGKRQMTADAALAELKERLDRIRKA